MQVVGRCALSAVLLLACSVGASAIAQERGGGASHVYILRGFMNLSPGIDQLGEKIKRRGIPTTVANHLGWSSLATAAIEAYKRGRLRMIAIVGHSRGGDAAIEMATELGRAKVPVQLVVTLDAPSPSTVPGNVRRVLNYYVADGIGVAVGKSGKSAVRNVGDTKADIGHFSIIAAHERQVIGSVVAAVRPAPAPEASPAPAAQ